ncbi:hypothetical protein MJH12_18050, partial [bacterium]|nr:hypothetical protein [bacterium]
MNQVIIFPEEVENQTLIIHQNDERFKHLTQVIGVTPGKSLKACLLNHGHIDLKLIHKSDQELKFSFQDVQTTKSNNINLVVGLSRPPSMKKL